MAFKKKPVDDSAEEAAEMPAKKKGKGKMPMPGASTPAWKKIAEQMEKK